MSIHDEREDIAARIKAALPSGYSVVLDPRSVDGRCVLVGLPERVTPVKQLRGDDCFAVDAEINVFVFITPPWDSEGGRRLMNDVCDAMSAVAQFRPSPAERATFPVAERDLDCYQFTVTRQSS